MNYLSQFDGRRSGRTSAQLLELLQRSCIERRTLYYVVPAGMYSYTMDLMHHLIRTHALEEKQVNVEILRNTSSKLHAYDRVDERLAGTAPQSVSFDHQLC